LSTGSTFRNFRRDGPTSATRQSYGRLRLLHRSVFATNSRLSSLLLQFKEQLRGLRHHDALAKLINDGIRQHVPEKQRRAVSTAFVARDMAALVDALGDGPQMAYWGFSYGAPPSLPWSDSCVR
jgi:hypothetical protein